MFCCFRCFYVFMKYNWYQDFNILKEMWITYSNTTIKETTFMCKSRKASAFNSLIQRFMNLNSNYVSYKYLIFFGLNTILFSFDELIIGSLQKASEIGLILACYYGFWTDNICVLQKLLCFELLQCLCQSCVISILWTIEFW